MSTFITDTLLYLIHNLGIVLNNKTYQSLLYDVIDLKIKAQRQKRAYKNGKTEDWRNILEVNVLAVAVCCREYLQSMDKRPDRLGHIIIITSVSAHQGGVPMANMYIASKHALKAFGMCLRRELTEKSANIKVTCVSPGLVATDIFTGTDCEELNKTIPILQSDDVARVVVDALSASCVTQICEVVLTPIPTIHGIY